jgi:hypothetical protein
VPAAKSKLPHVVIHGAFLVVREAGLSRTRKHRCLREPRGRLHLVEGCSRGEGPGADLRGLCLLRKMTGAALIFNNPAVFGLPRARGILTPVDAKCIDTSGCRWISCRKNTGYHVTDPKIRTQGAERGRSWIATKHGDGSLKSSNTQRTAERDAEIYPGSGPSW